MSFKEFFAFSNLKQSVIEFLKNHGDFENLHDRCKKPFRANLNKFAANSSQTTQQNKN